MVFDNKEPWHLDKKVPLGLILGMALNLGFGAWFASKLDSRVSALEANKAEQRDRDDRQDKATTDAVHLLRADMKDIKDRLDRLIERGSGK